MRRHGIGIGTADAVLAARHRVDEVAILNGDTAFVGERRADFLKGRLFGLGQVVEIDRLAAEDELALAAVGVDFKLGDARAAAQNVGDLPEAVLARLQDMNFGPVRGGFDDVFRALGVRIDDDDMRAHRRGLLRLTVHRIEVVRRGTVAVATRRIRGSMRVLLNVAATGVAPAVAGLVCRALLVIRPRLVGRRVRSMVGRRLGGRGAGRVEHHPRLEPHHTRPYSARQLFLDQIKTPSPVRPTWPYSPNCITNIICIYSVDLWEYICDIGLETRHQLNA